MLRVDPTPHYLIGRAGRPGLLGLARCCSATPEGSVGMKAGGQIPFRIVGGRLGGSALKPLLSRTPLLF